MCHSLTQRSSLAPYRLLLQVQTPQLGIQGYSQNEVSPTFPAFPHHEPWPSVMWSYLEGGPLPRLVSCLRDFPQAEPLAWVILMGPMASPPPAKPSELLPHKAFPSFSPNSRPRPWLWANGNPATFKQCLTIDAQGRERKWRYLYINRHLLQMLLI